MICLHAHRGVESQARLYLGLRYVCDPVGDVDGDPFEEGYRKSLTSEPSAS